MGETFIKKNNLGVDIEYTVIGKIKYEKREYIIYTDFATDEKDIYKLYVDLVNGDKHTTLENAAKNLVLDEFRLDIDNFINNSQE